MEPPGLFQPHSPALLPETPTGRTRLSRFLTPAVHKKSPSFDELIFLWSRRDCFSPTTPHFSLKPLRVEPTHHNFSSLRSSKKADLSMSLFFCGIVEDMSDYINSIVIFMDW